MSCSFAKYSLTFLFVCQVMSSAFCSESAFSFENLKIVTDNGINAWCDSNVMKITREMWSISESEDELAAIVAHEKAHLVLKHGEKTWCEKIGEWFTGWFTDESKPRFRGPPDPKSMARENVTELLVV